MGYSFYVLLHILKTGDTHKVAYYFMNTSLNWERIIHSADRLELKGESMRKKMKNN
jgi:hypothetical protein